MKKSIKFLLVIILATVSLGVSAQVGIQVGYSRPNISGYPFHNDLKSMNGFQAGINYEMGIQGPVSLQYALLYSFSTKSTDSEVLKLTHHSLDLPVHVAVTLPVTADISVFAFGGPNFSYALATNYSSGAISGNLYKIDDNLSRFNLQLGVGGGLKFQNFMLKVGYDWGVLDLNKSNLNVKMNKFTAALSYAF